MTSKQFNELVENCILQMSPAIKEGDSIFEFGCGVGAALKHINDLNNTLTISGSDFSENAIEVIKTVFPNPERFFCMNMKDRHPFDDNTFDHTISMGALAMYLKKDEMLIAMKEAVRITKPGGSLCFTTFLEEDGIHIGTIVERVNKSFWIEHQDNLGIENIKFFQMKNNWDRYFFVCNKR